MDLPFEPATFINWHNPETRQAEPVLWRYDFRVQGTPKWDRPYTYVVLPRPKK